MVGDTETRGCFLKHRLGMQLLSGILLLGTVALQSACSRVVTPTPTRTLPSVSAPPTASRGSQDRATATAPPMPPVDTPTPTITPTPIVHVVQQGDTLLAIALDYGVSVEALQSANGIENPQFLQLDQRLIIPVNEEESEASSHLLMPTPTPQPVQVRGVALYETPVGSLWVLGEIANTTAVTLTNVQVQVMLFDQDGQLVAETDAFAEADLILPQASSPFGVLFTTPPAWASYQVTIIRGQEAGALADTYVSMALVDVDGTPLGSQFEVSGTVANASTGLSAKSIDIIVTTYDAQGAVTGFRQHTVRLEEALAPGAKVPFSLSLAAHGGPPDEFSIIALGLVADA
jgi:LysM repeat protein